MHLTSEFLESWNLRIVIFYVATNKARFFFLHVSVFLGCVPIRQYGYYPNPCVHQIVHHPTARQSLAIPS